MKIFVPPISFKCVFHVSMLSCFRQNLPYLNILKISHENTLFLLNFPHKFEIFFPFYSGVILSAKSKMQNILLSFNIGQVCLEMHISPYDFTIRPYGFDFSTINLSTHIFGSGVNEKNK